MYCKNCGAKLLDMARFCTDCGTKVEEQETTQLQEMTESNNDSAAYVEEGKAGELPELDLTDVFKEEPQEDAAQYSEALQQRFYEMDKLPEESQTEENVGISENANIPFQQPYDSSVMENPVMEDSMMQNPVMKNPTIGNSAMENRSEKLEKPKKKGMFIGITTAAALVLFLISAGVTGFFVSKNTDQKNAELKAEIAEELHTYLDFCDKASSYKEQFAKFYMEDAKVSQLNEKLEQAREQIVHRGEAGNLENWLKDMDQFVQDTEQENIQYAKKLEDKFAEYDTLLMTQEEEKKYKEKFSEFQELVKSADYASAVTCAKESYEYGDKVTQVKSGWNISIVQQDISSYPTVRLYLDITDGANEVVENINKKYFILSEQQGADEEYLKQEITKATQLNQAERLNISMVADVSGSMDMSMPRMQYIMCNFLENVQFDVGDQIELSSFCDDFQIEEYFTSDRASLENKVNELEANGGTKFYDSLIEAAQRVYLQEGARCVIAFTDGLDNCSSSNENDVINYANQYNVPIFIIGIGIGQDYEYQETLIRIAEETGGFYRHVDQVSDSLEEVYNSIYRQQKEVYCVEYKTDAEISMAKTRNVRLYIKGEENGGAADYSYTPKDDYFGVLLGKMLNAYSRSVENKDYSYLENSKTIKAGGEIETEYRSYVKKDNLEISQILNYEVTDLVFKDKNTCIMTTRETYDINQTKDYNSEVKKQRKNKKDVDAAQIYDLLTYRYYEEDLKGTTIEVKKNRVLKGTYKLVRTENGEWKFKDFEKNYEVESSDVYSACIEGDYDNWE